MTDQAITGQLKALADDASHVAAAKALARSAANAEGEWRTWHDGQVNTAEEMLSDVGTPAARARSQAFYSFVTAWRASNLGL